MRDNPDNDQAILIRKTVEEGVGQPMKDHMEELKSSMAASYAELFSVNELKQLISYYRSPVMQRMVETRPQIISNLYRDFFSKVDREIARNMTEQLTKNGLHVPKELTEMQ